MKSYNFIEKLYEWTFYEKKKKVGENALVF